MTDVPKASALRGRRLLFVPIAVLLIAGGTAGVLLATTSNPQSNGPAAATSTTQVPAGSAEVNGYLASLSNAVIFIQWTESNGQVTGSAEAVYLSDSGAATSPEHETVTGSIQGSNLTLSVTPDGLYGTSDLSGTLQGSGFVLTIPSQSGALVPVSFVAATAAQYDSDVAALSGQATQASNAQAQAQQQAAAAAARQQAEQTASGQAGTVAGDISGLESDAGGFAGDLATMKSDVQTTATDLASTQTAAGQVETEAKQSPGGNDGQVCDDAYQVGDDGYQVGDDAYQVEDDAYQIEDQENTISDDESGLTSDFQSFQQDLSTVPGYSVAQAPTQHSVNSAIAAANNAQASAVKKANQYIDDANADVTAAYNAANSADNAGSCGSAGSGSPETTIP